MNLVSKSAIAACVGAALALVAAGTADAHMGGAGGHMGGFGGFGGHMGGNFGGHVTGGSFHGFGGHGGHGGHHFRGPFVLGLGGYDGYYDGDYYDYGSVGTCRYYRVRANETGRSYWWARYRECLAG